MPVPKSSRGAPITGAPFTEPFESPVFPYGVGGLDLASPVDRIAVGRYSRLTNLTVLPNAPGGLTARPGLTSLATAGTEVHSLIRMNDPQVGGMTRVWGIDTEVYLGASGALTQIDTGYSGDPLTFVQYHPPLSGDPWVFVADRSRMRKVRFDGLDLPIALTAPTVAAVTTVGSQNTTPICAFAAADGSQAALWTGKGGISRRRPRYEAYNNKIATTDEVINGVPYVQFRINPPPLAAGSDSTDSTFYGFWGLPKTLDLSVVGALPAADADAIHLFLMMTSPERVTECRIYFVCSPVFTPGVLPGVPPIGTWDTGPPLPQTNTDYFVKSFRPDDFTPFLSPNPSPTGGAAEATLNWDETTAISSAARGRGFTAVTGHAVQRVDADFLDTQDPKRALTVQGPGGGDQVVEYATIGIPLRRGDFRRYGSTPNCDWNTITGIVVYLSQAMAGADIDAGETPEPANVMFADAYLLGGAGPDTMDAATQSYDLRYTHYDPRTGDESNPSPEQADTAFLDTIRTPIQVTPTAAGDANLRQRFYRRGGILPDDWYYLGENASDGGVFTDSLSDLEIAAAGTLAIDNYEPVPTVDDAGVTVLAQPVPVIIGPYNGQLFALGDPYRPGTVYASKPGAPDHWPPDFRCEVCGSGEELLNGVMYAGQILLFSREASYFLYPNLLGNTGMTANPAGCTRGLAGRWALTTGGGLVWGVAKDGVFVTSGGTEEIVSDDIAPLFRGQTVHGYLPIDLTIEAALRLAWYRQELYFGYQDTNGDRQVLIYAPLAKTWRAYTFAVDFSALYPDEIADTLILGGLTTGTGYTHSGFSDAGAAISWAARTGAWDWGRPREEKLFGDQFLDLDAQNVALTLQNFVDSETVTNPPQALTASTGRTRAIFDSFGTTPQRGRNLAVEVRGSSDSAAPILYLLGTSITPQPDITINRVTNWDDLGAPDQAYVIGITLDADTGGQDRTLIIERDWQNAISTISTLTINHNGRHKIKYSWPALPANQVRLRPDSDCGAWICYRADWIAQAEPPRIAGWDTYFENAWDQYLTGLDLFCDTEGQAKTVVVTVDGAVVNDPATGLGFFTVTATGKQVVHLTFPTIPPLRGHVLHLVATDGNVGILYDLRWQTVAEPSEQTNWNQPFTIMGTQADKYVKAVIFEVDTFNQAKSVQIEADGVVVDTVSVTANGRKVVQIAIPQQLGRVWRFLPSDANPSRLYSLRLVFDEEPFALTRWETQEIDHEQDGFYSLIALKITLKSSADVTLTITTYINQLGGTVVDTYTLPSTGGLKQKQNVEPYARKGVLTKYLFTCDQSFWLYQEESQITIQPWEGGAAPIKQPFGNSDVDRTRRMVNASLAATQSGGGT